MNSELEFVCKTCGTTLSVVVDTNDLAKWERGESVQKAFPYLPASDRELFLSGICGKCFDSIWEDFDE